MKYLAAALALACAGAGAAPVRPDPAAGLRRALQQYHPERSPAPRQLSAGERAELRRQIAEQGSSQRRR